MPVIALSHSCRCCSVIDGKAVAQTIRSKIAEEVRFLSKVRQGSEAGSGDSREQEGLIELCGNEEKGMC
ncbi:hypothetical protein HN51_014252 [Arachis hypogaea]|nr:uncharacterized protein DS421_6g182200 [Arachis hypogaea]